MKFLIDSFQAVSKFSILALDTEEFNLHDFQNSLKVNDAKLGSLQKAWDEMTIKNNLVELCYLDKNEIHPLLCSISAVITNRLAVYTKLISYFESISEDERIIKKDIKYTEEQQQIFEEYLKKVYLPQNDQLIIDLNQEINIYSDKLKQKIEELYTF